MQSVKETERIRQSKHKRRTKHVVIVTSDAVDANVRQFRIRPWVLQTVIVVLCVLIGALIGYIFYEDQIWNAVDARSDAQIEAMNTLEQEKTDLESQITVLETEITSLNEQISILSETVSQKTQSETELSEQLESQSLPTEFPLSGAATMEESEADGNPICVFTATEGNMVVAAASGTVTAVNDDVEYGHNVWVDHGNGYVTIYRNQGDARVEEGDTVVNGTPLFLIGEDNDTMGYQMMLDGEYINPMELLDVKG